MTGRSIAKRAVAVAVLVAAVLSAVVIGAVHAWVAYAFPEGRQIQLKALGQLEDFESTALRLLADDPEAAGSYLATIELTRQKLQSAEIGSLSELWTQLFPVVFAYTLFALLLGLVTFVKWPRGRLHIE